MNPKQAARERFARSESLSHPPVDAIVRDAERGKEPGSHSLLAGDTRCATASNLLNIEAQAFTRQQGSNILIDSFCCSKEKGLVI